MKKTLLTLFCAATSVIGFAQPSPQWTVTQNSNFSIPAAGIRFLDVVDQNVVWASGYDGFDPGLNYCWVTKTNNGGTSWTVAPVWSSSVNPSVGDTNTYVMANIDGINATTAWVAAYEKGPGAQGGIFRTTDGGATWTDMTAAGMYTNAASFCNYVFFLTPSVGITAGDPHPGNNNEHEIWRTTDGGNTWSLVPGANIPNPVSGEYGYVNVYEKHGTTHAWLGTNRGRVYRTTDAGLTWSVSTVNASNTINDIAFTDANNGIVVTFVGTTTTSTIYRTSDGGATWTLVTGATSDPNYGRNDICAIKGTSWYASCGAGTGNQLLSFSMDGGATWNNWGSTGIQYLAMDFSGPQTGWAGSFSDQTNPALGGMWKYTGPNLTQAPNANFSFASATVCVNDGIVPTNSSTGNPTPTYTWSASPSGAVFSSSTAATPTITFGSAGIYTLTLQASNSVSLSVTTATVNASLCTGINENGLSSFNFFVYPNPAKDMVNLTIPSSSTPYEFNVTNVLGSVVYSEKATVNSGSHQLNLSELSKGVYFLTVSNNGSKTTKKFIIE